MKKLLIIAHAPSPNLQALQSAIVDGAQAPEIDNVEVKCSSPFDLTVSEVLEADALILLTPENLGYMSGALKDFFDRCFYDLDGKTDALPYALAIRAGSDGTGTRRAVESIAQGLKWKAVQAPVIFRGQWREDFLADARELGMALAAALDIGIYS